MSEPLKEACGIFAIANHKEASHLTYLGLYAQQHRGQESAGIVTCENEKVHTHIGMGLVADVFNQGILDNLKGDRAIGHVRYSTTGSSDLQNAQPIVCEYRRGWAAVAHNGNIVNTEELRSRLEAKGSIFRTTTDSEIIIHLLARSKETDFAEALQDSLRQIRGAFSLVVMDDRHLIGLRDPWGFRPLSIGKLNGSYIFCSETCALNIIGAEYIRSVEPGEMVIIKNGKMESRMYAHKKTHSQCIFELIYFSRPDSMVYGRDVQPDRENLGKMLARECPTDADVVIPVPDSSVSSAIGYSIESGIPYRLGIIRSHYIGRTFIEPSQSIRDFGAKIKYSPVKTVLKDKRVVVVDDSIVRGTTIRKIVKMVRECGAKEIHLRIASPVWISPCYYGVDTPERSKLIGATHSLAEIKKHLRVDSLHYLTINGLLQAVNGTDKEYCLACFNAKYPVPFNGFHGDTKTHIYADEKLVKIGV